MKVQADSVSKLKWVTTNSEAQLNPGESVLYQAKIGNAVWFLVGIVLIPFLIGLLLVAYIIYINTKSRILVTTHRVIYSQKQIRPRTFRQLAIQKDAVVDVRLASLTKGMMDMNIVDRLFRISDVEIQYRTDGGLEWVTFDGVKHPKRLRDFIKENWLSQHTNAK
jgi:lipopolysaccharide/colanic/teichoic acid biosynthesis glycosyltransferase